MRRLRRTPALRSLVRETHLHPGALVYPLFLCPGEGVRKEVASMPGVFNLSIDEALKEAESCAALGLGGLLLFGLPAEKDDLATGAYADNGIVQQGLRALKANRALDGLVLIADVCLCEYTSHGHCGFVPTKIPPPALRRAKPAHRERRNPPPAHQNRRLPRPGRGRHRRPQRHDGRPRRSHPRSPRRRGPQRHAHPQLRLQVRLRLLRPLPRGRRFRPAVRRPHAAIRWTAPTSAKPCARSTSTSPRAPTWS